jgi:hypothetical protein
MNLERKENNAMDGQGEFAKSQLDENSRDQENDYTADF